MGLTAVLQDESGEAIDRVEDPTNILHRLLPTPDDAPYQYLGTIDWYGDTVFNYLQAPRFLEEWRRLTADAPGSHEAALLHAIEVMAERVAKRHLYLKFYGD